MANSGNSQNPKNENNSNNSKTKRLIPNSIVDLISLSKRVVEEWKKRPEIVISWIDVNKFEQKVNELEDAYNQKSSKMSKRSPIITELLQLEKEMRKNLNYIKQFISYRFGLEMAKSYYPEFGINKVKNGRYDLGADRDQIVDSLKKLVKAVEQYNMDHPEFGKEYWQNLYQKYVALKEESVKLTQSSSGNVRNMKKNKEEVKKILSAVRDAIKINYTDDYKNVLMEFGFLKTHN